MQSDTLDEYGSFTAFVWKNIVDFLECTFQFALEDVTKIFQQRHLGCVRVGGSRNEPEDKRIRVWLFHLESSNFTMKAHGDIRGNPQRCDLATAWQSNHAGRAALEFNCRSRSAAQTRIGIDAAAITNVIANEGHRKIFKVSDNYPAPLTMRQDLVLGV